MIFFLNMFKIYLIIEKKKKKALQCKIKTILAWKIKKNK